MIQSSLQLIAKTGLFKDNLNLTIYETLRQT
uniref:Uncharacterized protein n=1 Tax=Medicago truncatula TaxID=3880 RepID=I3T3B7_MEDTR|nr:unknown [Medicago truncatula]